MAEPKPPRIWRPAASTNFTPAERRGVHVSQIVSHVTQGSWSGSINWFQNPSARVSAHFVIRSSDGMIAQCVRERDIAWHAGNWDYNVRSIGIEHEGFVDDPKWFTDEMYRSSAKLAAYLHGAWTIPIDRTHVIGHYQVAGSDHTDPGKYWRWGYYLDLIRYYWNR